MWLLLPGSGRIFELCIDTDNYFGTNRQIDVLEITSMLSNTFFFSRKSACNNKC